jgi:hypothetical protein
VIVEGYCNLNLQQKFFTSQLFLVFAASVVLARTVARRAQQRGAGWVAVIDQGWAPPPGNAWPGTRPIELARFRLLPMAKVGYPVFTRRCRTPRPRGWSSSITTNTNGRPAPPGAAVRERSRLLSTVADGNIAR